MTTTLDRTRSATDLFDRNETRVEGREKVSGQTIYTADVHLPNMLWAAYATSPHAYARIRRIDTTAAKAVPGVKAVITWHDIGRLRLGRQIFDWPVLCYDTVRFIGDRVAAVAAETRSAAETAARLVEVEYEELEPMLGPAESLRDDAPAIHPEWASYHYLAYAGKPKPTLPHRNLQARLVIDKGDDPEPILASGAYRVFEHVFETPRQHCGYIEPHATLVWIDDDGTLHVHSPNKSPFALREQLAHVTGTPREKIVVESNAIGGDFGGKGITVDEFPCYFLAKATGRPVRYVHSYSEELQQMNTRHPATLRLRTAVDANGTFVAHVAEMLYNGGAYGATKPTPSLLQGLGFGTVPYHIPNSRLDVRCAYTNVVPSGHMRAPGDVQTYFGWEQHVDLIAGELGIDPLALRKRNVIRPGQVALTDEMVPGAAVGMDVLERLERELRAAAPLPAASARGIAFVCRHTGQGKAEIKLILNADGSIQAVTGVPDQGSGGHTVIRRVAAAVLAVNPERIGVRRYNTSEAVMDPGAGASRVTHVQGTAARIAAERLRAELEQRSGMRLADDAFVDPAGGRASIEEIAAALCANGPIEVLGRYDGEHHTHEDPADYSFSAFAIDVAVDRETGGVRVQGALLVTDVGQIINPIGHQGQLDGGFVYGIGGALMEEMPVDDTGRLQTPNLNDYKLPTFMDVPPLRTILVTGAPGRGPFGAKMAGELSNSGVAPAIANGIAQAVGVRLFTFPLTAERVYQALLATAGQPA